ncbi:MAG TPA: glycoside hydrolase family 36 protein [Terriglobia bacterium]|nr:glycoside hydrolase family 36 protein [Terriglobia bacterium]
MLRHVAALIEIGWLVMGLTGCSRIQQGAGTGTKLISRADGFRVESSQIALECGHDLGLRVFLKKNDEWTTISSTGELPAVTSLRSDGREYSKLALLASASLEPAASTPFGEKQRVHAEAQDPLHELAVTLDLDFPTRYPNVVVITSSVKNLKPQSVTLDEINQARLVLSPGFSPKTPDETLFWSLQGGGYKWGGDFILPVHANFTQDNYTGPKGKANGGGIPFVDLWRPETGVAAALLEPKPPLAWLPVTLTTEGQAQVRITTHPSVVIPSGESYTAAPVMVVVHERDFYDPMVRYRQLMSDLGVPPINHFEPDDYTAAWCTWGYQRTFTIQDIDQKMAQMKTMGMKELILDDGWFDRFGDWEPTRKKFPRGESDMKALIQRVHDQGLTFRLWWSPGSADPGSTIDKQHADWFILDKDGQREKASWNAYYLCPAYKPVQDSTRALVERFVKWWGVDSFKIDGTDLNHAPLCYNPAHHHARPEESFEQWADLFREIRETAMAIRRDFRIELCPCGITPTYQLGTAFEQPVTSDPSDTQVTNRVKFLKAWFGPSAPVLEEYVGLLGQKEPNGKPYEFRAELFPRAIGTGAVVSTFSPVLNESHAQWTATYNKYRLAEGEYLNLYDIGWDNPEGHVIRKEQKLYYGFFTRVPGEEFNGKITLHGLSPGHYRVTDYMQNRTIGEVAGPDPVISSSFRDSLLLMADPVAGPGK